MSEVVEHEPREQEELAHHPTPRQYIQVAVVLGVVTALEVAIYYVEAARSLLVPFLLAFAFIKFVLVALWFMHLRFDSKMFRRFFITGLMLALVIFGVVLWIFFTSLGGAAPTAG